MKKNNRRKKYFFSFNNYINITKNNLTPFSKIADKFDFFIVGSDQVWNPNFGRLRDVDLLKFARNEQKIAFSASFGVSSLNNSNENKIKRSISTFKAVSVREDEGKRIIEKLTKRTDVEVLVDPTMLLTAEKWDKVSKKPNNLKYKKYILNYFLGELSEQRKNEINKIAKENNCDIINILDNTDPMYESGPSEFLWLEKNAFLICTDSFHSSVFAILYNRPFVVFNREDKEQKMNSRIDTLISKFKLKNREYNGKNITKDNLNHDYTEAYRILEEERKKSDKFLRKALEIKESE